MNLCQNEANKSTSPWGSKSQQQEEEEEKGRWETAPSFPRFRPPPRPFEMLSKRRSWILQRRQEAVNRRKVRGAEEETAPLTGVREDIFIFLSFAFSFYSVQFKAFAVRTDSKHYSDVQKSWASHHFFIFCFQAVRLSYFLKCSWATFLQSFWRSFKDHWMLFHSFSVLVPDHFHRNALFVELLNTGSSFEPFNALIFHRSMLCLHVTDNLYI